MEKNDKRKFIIVAILVLAILGLVVIFYQLRKREISNAPVEDGKMKVEEKPASVEEEPALMEDVTPEEDGSGIEKYQLIDEYEQSKGSKKLAVVIYDEYSRSGKSENGNDHKIWQKIEGDKPELLLTIEDIKFSPEFKLSPGKLFLIINLMDKLQAFDLKERSYTDLFIPRKEISGVVFSPDGEKMLIWDQANAFDKEDNREFFIHLLDWKTGKLQFSKKGFRDEHFFEPLLWRKDDKIFLDSPWGEGASLFYYDLASGEIIDLEKNIGIGFNLYGDGDLFLSNSFDSVDICNEFSGVAEDGFEITDPISNEPKGRIERINRDVIEIAFSPDQSQALLLGKELFSNKKDCDREPRIDFFLKDFSKDRLKEITSREYYSTLKKWNKNDIGASVDYSERNHARMVTLFIQNKPVVESAGDLRILNQFYR